MTTKTGDWSLARRLLKQSSKGLAQASRRALRQEAERLRTEIVQGLTTQSPGGKALAKPAPLTLAARALKGRGGTKSLIVRGDLRNSVAVVPRGDRVFVGVPRKARSPKGQALVDVARVQEFGSDPIVVPLTPSMRRFLFMLMKRAGQTPQGGAGRGVVVIQIPPRPFLRPAFKAFSRGAQGRFLRRVARLTGMRGH